MRKNLFLLCFIIYLLPARAENGFNILYGPYLQMVDDQ